MGKRAGPRPAPARALARSLANRWTETTAFVIYVETRADPTARGVPQTRMCAHHLESGRSITRRGADPEAVFAWIRKALERIVVPAAVAPARKRRSPPN